MRRTYLRFNAMFSPGQLNVSPLKNIASMVKYGGILKL